MRGEFAMVGSVGSVILHPDDRIQRFQLGVIDVIRLVGSFDYFFCFIKNRFHVSLLIPYLPCNLAGEVCMFSDGVSLSKSLTLAPCLPVTAPALSAAAVLSAAITTLPRMDGRHTRCLTRGGIIQIYRGGPHDRSA